MAEIMNEKARMREAGRAIRQRMELSERHAASMAMARYAPAIAAAAGDGGCISIFSTFGDELNTRPLSDALGRLGAGLALPVVAGRGKPLIFRRWQRGDKMGKGPFGIAEPLDTAPEVEPDLFLVPLLVFDRRGYRVGYGGGFYDRTLAQARADRPVLALGLAFAAQEIDVVPIEPFDEALDGVLTEREAVWCSEKGRAHAASFSR